MIAGPTTTYDHYHPYSSQLGFPSRIAPIFITRSMETVKRDFKIWLQLFSVRSSYNGRRSHRVHNHECFCNKEREYG